MALFTNELLFLYYYFETNNQVFIFLASNIFNKSHHANMKKLFLLSAAALSIALVFSCQKEVGTATASRNPQPLAGCGTGPATAVTETSTLTYSPTPAVAGSPVTLTYGVSYSLPAYGTSSDNNGKYQLFRWDNATAAWAMIKQTNVSTPSSTFTFTPSADSIGDCAYRFRVHFIDATGPICIEGHKYSAPNTDQEFCVKVVSSCTAPISLKGKVTCVTMSGDIATITLVYTVKTCGLSGPISLKTQGGLSAGGSNGATLVSVTASSGITPTVNTLNNNYVISATETFAASETKTYTIVYQRVLSGSDIVSGSWSTVSSLYPTVTQSGLPASDSQGCE